jgi:hypothetical protein
MAGHQTLEYVTDVTLGSGNVTRTLLVLSLMPIVGTAQDPSPLQPDRPIQCERCEAWNRHVEPYRVFGNTYNVGVAGLSAILIASDDGHILVDGDCRNQPR